MSFIDTITIGLRTTEESCPSDFSTTVITLNNFSHQVKYFLEVNIAHQVENAVVDLKQIFAFVHWQKPHQQKDIINQHVAYFC